MQFVEEPFELLLFLFGFENQELQCAHFVIELGFPFPKQLVHLDLAAAQFRVEIAGAWPFELDRVCGRARGCAAAAQGEPQHQGGQQDHAGDEHERWKMAALERIHATSPFLGAAPSGHGAPAERFGYSADGRSWAA